MAFSVWHAQACEAWFTERQEAIQDQKTSTVDERRDLIVKHARGLGWAEEFDLSGHALEALKRSSIIRKACAKNVTDKVLTNLEDTINEVLTLSKATRLADAKDALFRKRLPVYEAAFKQCRLSLHPTEPYPSPRQLFEVPLVRNLIVDTPEDHELTAVDFKPMSDNFRTLVDDWRARVSLNLKNMIATAYDSESMLDQDNILDLATSIFMCAICQGVGSQQPEPISYPRVLSHTCALSVHRNLRAPVPQAEGKALREVLGEVEWNASGALTYNKDMAKFIGDVLELCGFDRSTTTKAEMDAANPVIECLSCHDERQGRVVMTWWTVLHHWTLRHSYPYIHNFFGLSTGEMKLRLVDDLKDADRIRTELAIHQAKKAVYWSSSICAHDRCHFIGSTVTCRKHWREEHGRPAQAGDILPRLDHRHFSEDCYLWPPWEVEELDLLEFTEIVVVKGS